MNYSEAEAVLPALSFPSFLSKEEQNRMDSYSLTTIAPLLTLSLCESTECSAAQTPYGLECSSIVHSVIMRLLKSGVFVHLLKILPHAGRAHVCVNDFVHVSVQVPFPVCLWV